ncbi:MAG: glycosyltransferase family 9 protein [Gemmatimonadota bacterium]
MSPSDRPLAVLRGGAVGDFILTLPAIEALRRHQPARPLWLVARPSLAILARPDRVIDLDGPALLPLFAPHPPEPGHAPSLLSGARLTLAYLAGADDSLRRRLEALTGGEAWLADPRPRTSDRSHIIDHLLAPLTERGIAVEDRVPHLVPAADAVAWAEGQPAVGGGPGPLVCLHPGSGGTHKCWPLPCFAELAADLTRAGCRPVVLFGPAEEERWGDRALALPTGVPRMSPPGLPEVAAVLARAALHVGNDSGPGHVAAAVGTPVLSLFGPTDPAIWAPRGPGCRVLVAPGGDLPSLGLDCVRQAALEMLAASGDPPHGR